MVWISWGDKSQCDWLPSVLPPHIKMVLTVLHAPDHPEGNYYYQKLQQSFTNFLELSPLDQQTASQILEQVLKPYRRTLQPKQREYVLQQYAKIGSPLYLKIVAETVRHWRSNTPPDIFPLASSHRDAVLAYLKDLHRRFHHKRLLVERVLGYLWACRGSLGEKLLYEILSSDQELMQEIEHHQKNATGKLPMAIWAQLRHQLSPFLRLDKADNLCFFHQEFGEGAKAQYSLELSRHLLTLLEKMLEDPAYQQSQAALTHSHLQALTHQKRVYPGASLKERVEYFFQRAQKDEAWADAYLQKLNQEGLFYLYHKENLWLWLTLKYSSLSLGPFTSRIPSDGQRTT